MTSKLKGAIIRLYFFGFFSEFVFLYPFYNLMFKESGLNQLAMSVLLVVMQGSKMLFDIPGGIFADIYSRKVLLTFSQCLRICLMVIWAFYGNTTTFFIGMVLWGFAISCMYGNLESYIYDLLKINNQSEFFPILMGRYYSVQSIAIAIGSYIATFMFDFGGYKTIMLCSASLIAVSALLSLTLPFYKVNTEVKNIEKKAKKELFRKTILAVIKKKDIMFYISLSVLQDTVFILLIDINTTMMIHFSYSSKTIGTVVALISGIKIVTNFFAGVIAPLLTEVGIVITNIIIYGLTIVFLLQNSKLAIWTIAAGMVLYSFTDIAVKSNVQKFIPSEVRATIMSGSGLFVSLFIILLNVINGILSNIYQYNITCSIIFGLLLAISIYLLTECKRVKNKVVESSV